MSMAQSNGKPELPLPALATRKIGKTGKAP